MRAMQLFSPRPIEERPLLAAEIPVPEAAADEILVRVRVCGVCRTDLHVVEGDLAMRKRPIVPGHQVVGVVARPGLGARRFSTGQRVGIAWLHRTCGACASCVENRENLCDAAQFTGWSADGGFAEYALVPEAFAYPIPDSYSDEQAAPLLCAGIIGYRALRASAIQPGQRLGFYGFGASAHMAIQVAKFWGCEVFVCTRTEAHRAWARKLGASWTGDSFEPPPKKLQGAVVFAPAGEVVPPALEALDKGGTLALAGIHMSAVPPLDYAKHLYHEKVIRSVAHATRKDGEEFLALAAEIGLRTDVRVFLLEQANEALAAVKSGGTNRAVVLRCSDRPA